MGLLPDFRSFDSLTAGPTSIAFTARLPPIQPTYFAYLRTFRALMCFMRCRINDILRLSLTTRTGFRD